MQLMTETYAGKSAPSRRGWISKKTGRPNASAPKRPEMLLTHSALAAVFRAMLAVLAVFAGLALFGSGTGSNSCREVVDPNFFGWGGAYG